MASAIIAILTTSAQAFVQELNQPVLGSSTGLRLSMSNAGTFASTIQTHPMLEGQAQPNQNLVLGQDRVPHVGQVPAGQVLGQQAGRVLAGHLQQATQAALGDVCLSCWGG